MKDYPRLAGEQARFLVIHQAYLDALAVVLQRNRDYEASLAKFQRENVQGPQTQNLKGIEVSGGAWNAYAHVSGNTTAKHAKPELPGPEHPDVTHLPNYGLSYMKYVPLVTRI